MTILNYVKRQSIGETLRDEQKAPVISQRNNSFRFQLNGGRVDARIDPRLFKKKRKKEPRKNTQKLAMLRNDRSRVFAWTSRTSRDNVAGRIRFRARLSAADFWCGYVMGHSGWRTVTSTWTIDVSYQLQFVRGGYAWDNCY